MVIHIMVWKIVDQILVCGTLWTKHQLIGISRNKLIFKWQHLDQSLLLQEPLSNRQWTCELLSIIQELFFAKIATCLETTKVLLIVLQSQMQRQTNTQHVVFSSNLRSHCTESCMLPSFQLKCQSDWHHVKAFSMSQGQANVMCIIVSWWWCCEFIGIRTVLVFV